MVVLVLFLSVGEFPGDARRPDDDSLLLHVVPEQFGSPDVDSRRIFHHLDEALLAPVLQVLGAGIAEAPVASPGGGPYQMERTVGRADDGRVSHDLLLSYLRF